MNKEKAYLFICGCTRSGTSTTAGLVVAKRRSQANKNTCTPEKKEKKESIYALVLYQGQASRQLQILSRSYLH